MSYFTALNISHRLFERLKTENPAWWRFVKDNIKIGDFYVDIRKDNSLNIYYNGGALLKITSSKNKINCRIHEYYLGKTGSRYVEYDPNRLPDDANTIKARIASRYSNTSENGIKAKLICDPNTKYIDSEFAYLTTRIDLTKLENDNIIFVELKRIEDGRLLTNKYEKGEPKILSQMRAYRQFVNTHKQEIIDYYKILFTIKHSLGILPQSLSSIENIDNYGLSEDVELYIEPYSLLTAKREKRIEAIKTILNKNNVIHNL
ncbi:hypothetical protein [Bacteroides ihuae]|uniref:hypothetical protein n=1 Tax=Bacteroides ihuae TaxID=1852362 RepID=UPI0008D98E56|nr:hypothetical protein [Bacteroides ihuae]